jgi:hypothetical protein
MFGGSSACLALSKGDAHNRMHSLAVDHMRATGKPYAQAYAHVYSARENQTLRNKVKSEHMASVMGGDMAYDRRNNPDGQEAGGQVQV